MDDPTGSNCKTIKVNPNTNRTNTKKKEYMSLITSVIIFVSFLVWSMTLKYASHRIYPIKTEVVSKDVEAIE